MAKNGNQEAMWSKRTKFWAKKDTPKNKKIAGRNLFIFKIVWKKKNEQWHYRMSINR